MITHKEFEQLVNSELQYSEQNLLSDLQGDNFAKMTFLDG